MTGDIKGARAVPARRPAEIRLLGDDLAICGALTADEIGMLAAQGVRTIFDLRGSGEPMTGLRPDVERRVAERAGLTYEHMPMAGHPVDRSRLDPLRLAIWAAERPLLIHCSSGRRAALCALIHIGCQNGWTIDQCLDLAVERGIDFETMPAMRDFLREYLRRHSRAYVGAMRRVAEPSYQI